MALTSSPLLLAFEGEEAPAHVLDAIRDGRAAGVALYRALNPDDPAGIRALSVSIQSAARDGGWPPAIIAIDQEGGQLRAVGEPATPFAGNLALGAVGDVELTQRVGRAIGTELAAMGVTVDWAPVADLATDPRNPAAGARTFGDDPAVVAWHVAAMVEGIQSTGVAATVKHFPGGGDTSVDPHVGLPVIPHDLVALREAELVPFQAAIAAGVKLVMAAHVATPALEPDGATDRPAMLSSAVLRSLLRDELGFDGVVVSDALDMGALDQAGLVTTASASIEMGVDLLLAGPGHAHRATEMHAISQRLGDGDGPPGRAAAVSAAGQRVAALRSWLGGRPAGGLEVVGCAEHRTLADELARRAITVVRDRAGLVPLHPPCDGRMLVVTPRPADLTPADTSSYEHPDLAGALGRRGYHPNAIETAIDPDDRELAGVLAQADAADLVIVGTINAFAHEGQATLVRSLAGIRAPVIIIAMRMPNDLEAFPDVGTYVCSYSIHAPSIEAVAAVLCGEVRASGRLPVRLSVGG